MDTTENSSATKDGQEWSDVLVSGSLRVLVVDDDAAHAEALGDSLEMDGCECRLAHTGKDGVQAMGEQTYDAILTDLVMHDLSGLEVLKAARRLQPDAAVIMITGHASIETAVDAMRFGAGDYLTKPVRLAELRTRLARVIEAGRLRRDNRDLRAQLDKRFGLEGIVGHSPAMGRVFDILRQVAPTNATVLVLGESGTGKELIARALHTNSNRKAGHFVAVNCAALSEGLIESELFGHVKGAFTGAITAKEGRIAYADGGTLFLDEIGDMPLETQAKLLRVIESREVQPVGGNKLQKVDIRILAATNRDLEAMVKAGTFREDLLFRLKVVTIDLPALRDRVGDVPLLLEHFISELSDDHGRTIDGIAPEARMALARYPWPGNVRELRNVVENMVLLARGTTLGLEDIPASVGGSTSTETVAGGYELTGRSLAEVERDLISTNLELVSGNRQKAAKMLGIGERTLYRKIKEYGLQ
ncbi:MAG: sigma-54 dependent transcriptional regulator [Planctomycetota bacterium]|nr:sigma-54 dependent transcriptional regulator [Planctomycetota bacterium]MDG2143959.1 sigma-54 dependent transcriptional regulator [Planctomycetota bacterium]